MQKSNLQNKQQVQAYFTQLTQTTCQSKDFEKLKKIGRVPGEGVNFEEGDNHFVFIS